MAEFLQFLFSGLTIGAIYALVALGFTLIYNASDVINFAQGEFVMIGGMVTFFAVAAGVPLPLAVLLAVTIAVLVGLCLYGFAIRPARNATAVTLIIITIGASIFLRGVAAIVFDKNFHSYPGFAGTTPLQIGGASVLPQSLIVLIGVGAIVLALWLLMAKTLVGKAIIATAANKAAAQLVGVNTGWIIALVVRGVGRDRRHRRHSCDADHADQLRCRHSAGAEGLCRRDARRHGQSARRGRRRIDRGPAGILRRRLSLVRL